MSEKIKVQLPVHLNIIVSLFGLVILFFILIIGAGIIIPLTFAFVFSLFLFPTVSRMEKAGLPRWLSVFISLLSIIVILGLVFSLIYGNLLSFSEDFPLMRKNILRLLKDSQRNIEAYFGISSENQLPWINNNLSGFVNTGGKLLNNFLNSATTFFTDLFLMPIYIFFMLYYRGVLKGFINRIIDDEHREKAVVIENQIIEVIQKYVTGLFTVILIISLLNITGLWMIGVKHAIFFGALAGLLTIIPYIGVFIGSLLPILYALVMTDSLFYPLAVFIWFQLVQMFEGNFITPNIVGSQVSLNPLIAIVTLLIGASVWGVSGMILFTPLTAMLKVFLDNIPALAPYGYLLGQGEKSASNKKKTNQMYINTWQRIKKLFSKKRKSI